MIKIQKYCEKVYLMLNSVIENGNTGFKAYLRPEVLEFCPFSVAHGDTLIHHNVI